MHESSTLPPPEYRADIKRLLQEEMAKEGESVEDVSQRDLWDLTWAVWRRQQAYDKAQKEEI